MADYPKLTPKQLNALISAANANLGYPDTPESHALMMETHLVEDPRQTRQQLGGPALGLFQMEPATARDIHENVLPYKPAAQSLADTLLNGEDPVAALQTNDLYAAMMTRLNYARDPNPIEQTAEGRYQENYLPRHCGQNADGSPMCATNKNKYMRRVGLR